MDELKMKFSSGLMLFLCVAGIGVLVAALMSALILSGGISTASIRIATVAQDLAMFCVPPVVTAFAMAKRPWTYLKMSSAPSLWQVVLAVVTMVASIPLMNCIISWNESIGLPEWMESMEIWMRDAENRAAEMTALLLGGYSAASMVTGILLMGLFVGFSEEIFFRGGLQNLISAGRNPHMAIWVTALVFSIVHLQFLGFVPRVLLGAFFGYAMYWSGSLWLAVICHALNNSMVVASQCAAHNGLSGLSWLENVGTSMADWPIITVSVLFTAVAIIALHHSRRADTC